MLGIGAISKSLSELWEVDMKTLNLEKNHFEPLRKILRINLDAQEGQYDEFIDIAITKSFDFCQRLVPRSMGEILQNSINLKEGEGWYEIPNTYVNEIKVANISFGSEKKLQLNMLRTFDFLNLSRELGFPKFYSNFNGKIGVNPIPFANNMILNLVYIGYSVEYFLSKCFDLIVSRAQYELHKDVTGDIRSAQQYLADFKEQLLSHDLETSKQNCEGHIIATTF